MQNNYKKIIENHPATIGTGKQKYDDTDIFRKMFIGGKDEN